MTRVTVGFGGVVVEVGLSLVKFPNGGSWSFFLCPQCARRARVLKLLEGSVVCQRCCIKRGVRFRCEPISVKKRAEMRIPKLRAMLESEVSLRLKPVLWGKLERRKRHEAALARAEFILSKGPRYGDVLKQTPEIEPEPIAEPKIKGR
jgi:hypothetical protein